MRLSHDLGQPQFSFAEKMMDSSKHGNHSAKVVDTMRLQAIHSDKLAQVMPFYTPDEYAEKVSTQIITDNGI